MTSVKHRSLDNLMGQFTIIILTTCTVLNFLADIGHYLTSNRFTANHCNEDRFMTEMSKGVDVIKVHGACCIGGILYEHIA